MQTHYSTATRRPLTLLEIRPDNTGIFRDLTAPGTIRCAMADVVQHYGGDHIEVLAESGVREVACVV